MSLTTEMLQSLVGIESEVTKGTDEVCRPMIRHYCEVMEDANPLYRDDAYAKTSRYGEIIAPPTQVQVYTMNPLWPKVEREKNSMENLVDLLKEHGYSSIVATAQVQEYFEPMKIGDDISYTLSVKEISPLKQTARGPGYFSTFLYTFLNQRNEVVCKQSFTILSYQAQVQE